MHIINHYRLPALSSRTTDAASQRYADTSWFPLKWTQNQLSILVEIEASPVEIGQRVIDQRTEVRRIGNEVMFALKQTPQLGVETLVEVVFRHTLLFAVFSNSFTPRLQPLLA